VESTPEKAVGDQYFRCGASGDVFELMERMDGLSFMESVSLLAEHLSFSAQGSFCCVVFFMPCFACLRNATAAEIHASQIT